MTLELLLLRHGKSDHPESVRADHERPLQARGEKAAAAIGRLLRDLDRRPDLVLSSSAVRALRTAEIVVAAAQWDLPIHVEPELYEATPGLLIDRLNSVPQEVRRVLVVGHEPWISGSVLALTGAHCLYPTAGLAAIELAAPSWDRVEPGTGRLQFFLPPRLLQR